MLLCLYHQNPSLLRAPAKKVTPPGLWKPQRYDDKMPLTRHLYELDEVVSGLQVCLRNRYGRAVFWLWELVVSDEAELALNTIRDIWLRIGGGYDPAIASMNPTTPEEWIALVLRVMEASKATGSCTAEKLLAKTATATERRMVTPPPKTLRAAHRRRERSAAFVASLDPAETLDHAADWWICLDASCRQSAISDAIWLLQAVQNPLSADAIWSALRVASRGGPATATAIQTLQAAASPHPTSQILHQTAAILLLCCRTNQRNETMLVTPIVLVGHYIRGWTSWTDVVGRRAARIHEIPTEALHVGTTRGSLDARFTNVPDLREPVPILNEGCRWWRNTIRSAGAVEDTDTDTLYFPDDDAYEAFMDTYFPDDIPDEWSLQEQQKSHGRGCASKAPPAPVSIPIREEIHEHIDWMIGIGISKGKRAPAVAGASSRRFQ